MGKYRVKPARSVAKPFKSNRQKPSEGTFRKSTSAASDLGLDLIQVPVANSSTSKISKRPKSRASALKKKSAAAAAASESELLSPKKSVTFASPSSNTVHVFPGKSKSKKDSIRDILREGAGALVNLVTRKRLNDNNVQSDKSTSSNSLNKVLKNQFKDKRTRRRLRTDAFHKKLSLMKASELETKAEKRRKETVIVGDMQPIAQILAELEEEVKASPRLVKKAVLPPKKKRRTLKKREQEMLDALKFFEAAGV